VGSQQEGQEAGKNFATRVAGIAVGCTELWEAPPVSGERVHEMPVGTRLGRNFAVIAAVAVAAAVHLGGTSRGWHTATSESEGGARRICQ
jgi:hypothetical protein